jgi:hypothetical protein
MFEKLMKNMLPIDFMLGDDKIVINSNEIVDFLIELSQYKNNKELILNSEKLSLF